MFERYEDDTGEEVEHTLGTDELDITPEETDEYLAVAVLLPLGDKMVSGLVRGRKRDRERSLHGARSKNTILDTRITLGRVPRRRGSRVCRERDGRVYVCSVRRERKSVFADGVPSRLQV
jgi:hypothetical protein